VTGLGRGRRAAEKPPVEPRNINRAFYAVLEDAKLPRVRVHDLRHVAATIMVSQGVGMRTVMETLGHSQISLTMNTYSHILDAEKRAALNAVESAFRRA
jgi:integrase